MSGQNRAFKLWSYRVLNPNDTWKWIVASSEHLDEVFSQFVFDAPMLVAGGSKSAKSHGQVDRD